MFAQETALEDATHIWDAWDAAFIGPNDPPLPHGFHQSIITTLTLPFMDPAALNAQLHDLFNRATRCIPTKLFTMATEDELEMGIWQVQAPNITLSSHVIHTPLLPHTPSPPTFDMNKTKQLTATC
jgi:hypothetical protein